MADTTSIFYKIGQSTKASVGNAITALKAADNTWTGTNDFNKAVSVGTSGANANLTVNGGATITGDLTVQGATTTLSTSNLDVKDNFVRLSQGASGGTFTKDQGFYFERAQDTDAAAFIFDESEDTFVVGTLAGSTTNAFIVLGSGDNTLKLEFTYETEPDAFVIEDTNSDDPLLNTIDDDAVANFVDNGPAAYLYFYSSSSTFANIITATASNDNITTTLTGSDTTSLTAETVTVTASSTTPASGSTDDVASTTPAPLTVGSLKVNTTALGDLADFNAGLVA